MSSSICQSLTQYTSDRHIIPTMPLAVHLGATAAQPAHKHTLLLAAKDITSSN